LFEEGTILVFRDAGWTISRDPGNKEYEDEEEKPFEFGMHILESIAESFDKNRGRGIVKKKHSLWTQQLHYQNKQ
jgi:hypothetical protein